MTSDPKLRSFEQSELFTRLMVEHQRRIYLFILALVHRPAEAEEILSDTQFVLWQKFEEFESGSNFLAWACQIARWKVMSHRKQRRHQLAWAELSDEVLDLVAETSLAEAGRYELRQTALTECMQKLRHRDRDLLERYSQPAATVAKIAAEVGRSVEGLYKAYQRIYKALAECIDRTVAREGRS